MRDRAVERRKTRNEGKIADCRLRIADCRLCSRGRPEDRVRSTEYGEPATREQRNNSPSNIRVPPAIAATAHVSQDGSSGGRKGSASKVSSRSTMKPLTRSAITLKNAAVRRPDLASRYQARTTSPPTDVGSTRLKNMPM